ncbi:efflux RND transporter periplasmic adaptor subunit [Clostridiaceae bacterium HSG29]|nr:efflux RND transporter periplasmic adaptor subunit [Clostridiaceae bacterium HSG29]
MRKLTLLIMIVLLMVGCSTEATKTEPISITNVVTTEIKHEIVEKTYISIGEIVPNNQVDIFATGLIESIYSKVGDFVSKGDIILSLESDNVKATYNSTESQLRTIRDNLKSQYNFEKENYINQEKLFVAGAISKSEFDITKNQLDSLYRQYNDSVVSYNNQLNNLNDTVNDKILKSTIDGEIAAIYFNEGQTLSNQMVISIIDQSKKYIKTFISSDLKRNLSIGNKVNIYVDGDKFNKHIGEISSIQEIPNKESKLFEIHIEAADSYDYIIGEYIEVEYILEKYMANLIPTKAIVRNNTESYIFIIEDSKAKKIKVTTGLTKGDLVEIKDIDDSLKVIYEGQYNVIDGEIVSEKKDY